MTTQQLTAIARINDQLDSDRAQADQASRPAFSAADVQTQINELVARIEVARMHKDRAMWDAARAELAALLNS